MRTLKSIFTSFMLIVLVGLSASAQSNAKVIAVVNEAEWCPSCKSNGARAMQSFNDNNKESAFQFVKNNLTNDETKLKSTEELKKFGLLEAMAEYKGTGVVYFFNAETKALINSVSIAKSNEELVKAMSFAQKGKTTESSEGGCN